MPHIKKVLFVILSLCISSTVIAQSQQTLASLKQQYKRPLNIPFPESNPYSSEKAQLGKMLFFDQRLSRHFNMNCATCHNPSLGWEDGVTTAFGGQGNLPRHSPTILNMAWLDRFFWDGRAPSLEEQLRGPIESPLEMNLPLSVAVERIKAVDGYQKPFARVFSEGITEQNILKAIATYERTLVSGTAPFDRWVEGDEDAISLDAIQGFKLFNTKANCHRCHSGWNFSDNQFHDIGLPTTDTGREKITQSEDDRFGFKTPGLRNISQRAPYMHNGSLKSLTEVMLHYVTAGTKRSSRSPDMQPVSLSLQEINQLIAFLQSLTGDDKPVSLPILPY